MNDKNLATMVISLTNMHRKIYRTVCMIILVSLFSFAMFSAAILTSSLKNGMDSMSKRLGADILVAPSGYDKSMQDVLLGGEPSTFYLDSTYKDKLSKIEGVKAVSPQLYIATLSASCCSYPLQLIGFDPKSDFVIQPWISQRIHNKILNGEIVVGSNVGAYAGDFLKFFGHQYKVKARMDKTGTGYDSSVFMNMTTAQKIGTKIGDQNSKNSHLVSSILIKVKQGYSINDVGSNILKTYGKKGIDVIVSKNMMNSISLNLNSLLFLIYILIFLFWILTLGVLTIVFTVTLNERKRELSILRSIGATRKKIVSMILCESSLISFIGSFIGIFFGCLFLFPFNTFITTSLKMPYLLPSGGMIMLLLFISFFLSFAAGPIASVYSAIKIGKLETYIMLQEGL